MIRSNGYNYTKEGTSFTATDSTSGSPKPGEAIYVGDTTPISAQTGDLWISSTAIKRWNGTIWDAYYGGTQTYLNSGITAFTGSSATITFSSAMATSPAVVINGYGTSGDTGFYPSNISTTGFTVNAYNMENNNPKSGTYTVNWIASSQGITGSTQAGVKSGTTDSYGEISVTFPQAFANAPSVVANFSGSIPATYEPYYVVRSVTTTGFKFRVVNGDNGNAITGVNATFSWIATPTT